MNLIFYFMRTPTLAASLLIAASVSAQTYTNNLNSSNPAVVLATGSQYQQWDLSQPYAAYKPWDVSVSDGNYRISGQASVTDAYVAQYPAAGLAGGATFLIMTSLPGLTSFTVADLNTVSATWRLDNLHTGGGLSLVLLTASGLLEDSYFLGGTATQSFVNNGGALTLSYSNFNTDETGRTYTQIGIYASATFTGGPAPGRNQYIDFNFDSFSVTVGSPIPEPSTYGLILGGLALVGAAIRRRAKRG